MEKFKENDPNIKDEEDHRVTTEYIRETCKCIYSGAKCIWIAIGY